MKRILYTLGSATLLALPSLVVVNAQAGGGIVNGGTGGEFGQLLINILTFTNNVLIPFIIGLGFLVFVWGMFKYFVLGGADSDKQKEGKDLMIYATLGFVAIIIFWGVVNFVVNSIGITDTTLDRIPQVETAP